MWKARNYEATLLKSRYVSVKQSEINILGLEMLVIKMLLVFLMLRMNHDLEVKVMQSPDE